MPTLTFLDNFQLKISGHSININNLSCNPVVLKKKKKKSKPLKIYIFGPNLLRKEEVYISDTQNKIKKYKNTFIR